jgi:alkanesulfonate monooxygenase SsuD/methylene tetrahydromethanopterin reductase-like flavin-dependent oxidoreductase (luciferase family)
MYIDMRNRPNTDRSPGWHYGLWLERIQEAERLGAAAVWLTEHHFFDDGYLPQCWTFAAAIAARTESVRIGSAVSLLPLHHPLDIAEQVALVDVISAGRVEAGFGVGYRVPEYRAFGGDFKRRYGVFAERIEEMRSAWGEGGGHGRRITPGPVQRPLPLWAGFGGPKGSRMAGRLGLGLQSLDRSLLDTYLEGLEEGGRPASEARMGGSLDFFLTEDPERAWNQIAPHVLYRWESYNRYMFEGTSREADPPQFYPEKIRDRFLIGTPDQVADGIRERTAGLPVTDVFGWSDYPGLADDVVERQIELAFTKLAPLLVEAP